MSKLVFVDPMIRSSYGARSKKRGETILPRDVLKPAVSAFGKRAQVTPGMAAAMLKLDAAILEATDGEDGLRCTELFRLWGTQASGRAKWDAWVAAGRPTPGTAAYQTPGMRNVFMCRAGESQHGWGGALDNDAYALRFPNVQPGEDSLAVFWDLARPLGFRPVNREPTMGSECWHYDFFGVLDVARRVFYERRTESSMYRRPYAAIAVAGHALVGTWQGKKPAERYIQALCLAAMSQIPEPDRVRAIFPGACDGSIGSKTLNCVKGLTGVEFKRLRDLKAINAVTTALHACTEVRAALAAL